MDQIGGIGCIFGQDPDCMLSESGTFSGVDGDMYIEYSGDDTTPVIVETLFISFVTNYFSLNIHSLVEDNSGRIEYAWDGEFPCEEDVPMCRPCSEYTSCAKFGLVPSCDGSSVVECVEP